MRRILYFLPLFIFISCSSENTHTNEISETPEEAGLKFDFAPYEINASLQFEHIEEKDSDSLIEILHEPGDIVWQVNAGEGFSFQIEDWDDVKKEINQFKEELNNQVFQYDIVEEGDDYLLYTQFIPIDTTKKNYHFHLLKSIEEINYVIQSDRMQDFSLEQAKIMLKVASSFKAKEKENKDSEPAI